MPELEKPKRSTRKKPKKGKVTTLIYFRSAADYGANPHYVLKPGTKLEIVADLGEWLKVVHEKTTGYVMAQYVKRVD